MLKLTIGQRNTLKKHGLDKLDATAPNTDIRTNPYSNETVELNELATRLYDKIKAIERVYQQGSKINTRDFDSLRYVFLTLFPDAWQKLLD